MGVFVFIIVTTKHFAPNFSLCICLLKAQNINVHCKFALHLIKLYKIKITF